jgi:Flp pilus assembly pilin Flp
LQNRFNEERGAGMAEYALLLFAIAVLSAGILGTFGDDLRQIFTDAGASIPADAVDPPAGG